MEILAGIVVILVLVFFLTGDWMVVALTVLGMVLLCIFLMLGAFAWFLTRVIRSVKTKGVFAGFEKSGEKSFERAVYEIDGKKYPDAFPAEPIFRSRIYKENTAVDLRFSEKRGEVYDRSTLITTITGTLAFGVSAAAIATVLISYFTGSVI